MQQIQSGVFSCSVDGFPLLIDSRVSYKKVKNRGQLLLVILTPTWQILCVHFGTNVSGGTDFDSTADLLKGL